VCAYVRVCVCVRTSVSARECVCVHASVPVGAREYISVRALVLVFMFVCIELKKVYSPSYEC
jgi:hypothetical protein